MTSLMFAIASIKGDLEQDRRHIWAIYNRGVKINTHIWDAASKVLKENQRLRQRICRHETLNEMLGKEDELAFEDRMIYNKEAPQQEYSVSNSPGELQTLCNGEALQQHYNFPTKLQTPCADEALQQYYNIKNLPTQLQTPVNDYNINNGHPSQPQILCDEEALPKATATSLFPAINYEFRNGEGNRVNSQSDDPALIERIREGRDQWMAIVETKMGRFQGSEENLDVAGAFAKQPDEVRVAILDAVRLIQPPETDINLLKIESNFWYSLKEMNNKWVEPKVLQSVFDACRQGHLKDKTEGRFHEVGGAAAVIALAVATTGRRMTLLRFIDALPKEELAELIDHVNKMPKGDSIAELAAKYNESERERVSNPTPQLMRPRSTRKNGGNATGPTSSLLPRFRPAHVSQLSNPSPPRCSKKRTFTPDTPDQLQHTHLPPINTISLLARQQSQTLPSLARLPIQPVYSAGQHQGIRAASQFSNYNEQNAVECRSPLKKRGRFHNTGLDLPQRPQIISQDAVSVSWHSPSKQRDQCHNTGLDLTQWPQTISQGAVFSEKIQGPPNVPYVQSKTDSQPRTMSQEVCVSFADGQPDLSSGTSEFGRFLQDRLITADCEETRGQPQLAWEFGPFLQDRLMTADCEETEFGEFLKDQLGYNEFASDFPEARVQYENSSIPSIYSN
ncbi:hypothetical protein V497_00414 [Pseudogymnoascus sp. VKM F-4516 (FW-969)]|nr:hypothetical protein V497_00414 [Pseudogymnoascus sp. VKM F-4516 (FW-969)]